MHSPSSSAIAEYEARNYPRRNDRVVCSSLNLQLMYKDTNLLDCIKDTNLPAEVESALWKRQAPQMTEICLVLVRGLLTYCKSIWKHSTNYVRKEIIIVIYCCKK